MELDELKIQLSFYIRENLANIFPNHQLIEITKNISNPGVESSIYFFTIEFTEVNSNKKEKDLVLKIYDGINSKSIFNPDHSVEIEYHVLKFLSKNNIPTPIPYAFEYASNTYFKNSFVIMDYISGIPFPDFIQNLYATGNYRDAKEYLKKMLEFMITIENLDFSPIQHLFPNAVREQDLFYYLYHDLDTWSEILKSKKVELTIFQQLFDWLKKQAKFVPITKYALINRDFKPGNFIVSNSQPISLDWSISYITDFRLGFGFTLMGLMLNSESLVTKDDLVVIYEQINKKPIEKINYFIVLALLKNLSIGYMLVNGVKSLNENKNILKRFYQSYNLLVSLTNQEFPTIKKMFSI